MRKRISALLLCLLLAFSLTGNALAASQMTYADGDITSVTATIPTPTVGSAKSTKVTVPSGSKYHAYSINWSGSFDANGCFVNGGEYTVKIYFMVNDGEDCKFYISKKSNCSINGNTPDNVVHNSSDGWKSIYLTYSFTLDDTASEGHDTSSAVKIQTINSAFYFDSLAYGEMVPYTKPVLGEYDVGETISVSVAPNGSTAYSAVTVTGLKLSTESPEPYSWFTAEVTLTASEGYYFTQNTTCSEDLIRNGLSGEYRARNSLTYVSADTAIVTVTQWVGASGLETPATDEMKDYWENTLSGLTANSQAPIAEGELNDPLNGGTNQGVCTWKWPTMCGLSVGKPWTKSIDSNNYAVSRLVKEVKIYNLHAEKLFPSGTVVGQWYLVGSGNQVGFVPASYVKNVTASSTWDGAPAVVKNTDFTFAGGTGTVSDPYLIQTADQLNSVRYGLDKNYKLIADIDLSNWGNWEPLSGTPAYGGYSNSTASDADKGASVFTGTFNGNGHVISGMTIVDHRTDIYMAEEYTQGNLDRQYSLFGRVSGSGKYTKTIYDLGIVNYTIDLSYTNITNWVELYVAPFASRFENATLYNCYSSGGTIKVNVDSDTSERIDVMACGLVTTLGMARVQNCYNTSNITVTSKNVRQDQKTDSGVMLLARGCGVAWELSGSIVENTFNTGNITVPLSTFWTYSTACGIADGEDPPVEAIGLQGWSEDNENASVIRNCYNTGSLYANTAVGILGYATHDLYIKNCYNVGKLTTGTYVPANNLSPQNWSADLTVSVSAIWKGNYIQNNGVSTVSGDSWQYSSKLGRKVLKAHPEDSLTTPTVTTAVATVGGFSDVKATSYYADAVTWAVDKSITNGTSTTTFSPNQTCNRAQILTFLWRAVGSPTPTISNPFSDVKSTDYYYKAALWAYEKGMVSGTTFGATTPCTRASTVTYLWQYSGSPSTGTTNQFTDVSSSASYAQAVAWAVSKGVTNGTTDTTFSPSDTCSRGQIVTFLYRALA